MNEKPTFSILHTSARPEQWRKVYDDWMSKADNSENVEYVLCIDERWGFPAHAEAGELFNSQGRQGLNKLVWNHGRMCYVDGVNTAARASTGSILIVNADDQFACEHWDTEILKALEIHPAEFVLEVSTGTPDEHERKILVLPVLSRSRYERLGYVFFPEYESMFADNEFCEHARQDGIVIDARKLMFPHRHFLFDEKGRWKQQSELAPDRAYLMQNRPEAYQIGQRIFEQRRANGFGTQPLGNGKVIAICVAGERFRLDWVLAFNGLTHGLRTDGWNQAVHSQYTPNVYVTRQMNLESVVQNDPQPAYVLFIDDDNVVNHQDVTRLLALLESRPDVDGAAGWCWIFNEKTQQFYPSCGHFSPNTCQLQPFEAIGFKKATEPRLIEWTGFPCFLIRREALAKMPRRPFLPILDESLEWGMGGEDASFCKRAMDLGLKFLVDPKVKVQHIKPRAIEPIFPNENARVPKVAAMLRVHNESRWIERVIRSLVPLCGENIFVLDDESTDDTAELARSAGAVVYADPFFGQQLDEARDKDWLMRTVIDRCSPEWIFCVDGDEELEPLGTEKIRGALQQNPEVDCIAVHFLYLWDRPDQVRLDRWYSNFSRPSLFRVTPSLAFKSIYAGTGVDCNLGLHVSNAPAGLKSVLLNVYLLHYGYMSKADRMRKYEYYNRIDPHNPMEDEYRHIVQGDIPEVPASAVLLHAGPLELKRLPLALIPKFAVELRPQVTEVLEPALLGAETKG